MGLLGDIYSASDGLKRKLRGLLDDPGGTLEQMVGRMGDDQRGLLNLQANAYPMAGDRTVLNSPQKIAGFRRELADKATEQAMAAATVWHGSPHKFDKFDSSKIGTGEGAQAYGHGLYLAESPETAKFYQALALKELKANPYDASVINRFMGKSETPLDNASDGLAAYALADANKAPFLYDPVLAMKNLRDKARASRSPDPWMKALGIEKQTNKSDFDLARKYIREFSDKTEKTGAVSHLYKVDLPDEHISRMLDWDAPLSQQTPEIQAIFGSSSKMTGAQALKAIEANPEQYFSQTMSGKDLTGAMIRPERGSSEFLKQKDIPGIRYLDGGSRSAGQGSQNYVIFPGNEGLLSILERNGAALK